MLWLACVCAEAMQFPAMFLQTCCVEQHFEAGEILLTSKSTHSAGLFDSVQLGGKDVVKIEVY
jgi:hypothetical protein